MDKILYEYGYIGSKGFTIGKDKLTKEQIKKLKQSLIVKPFIPDSAKMTPNYTTPSFPVYRESMFKLYLPRFYVYRTYLNDKEYLSIQSKIQNQGILKNNFEFKGELRDFQKPIIQSFLDSKTQSGLLELACGMGKTVCALYIASKLKRKTIIIVHKEFLMNQWIERIKQFLPSVKIGKIQGSTIDIENKEIVIGMLQSISMKEYPQSLFQYFGFAVFDECHHISAEVFCRSLFKIVCPYMLGLSATMKRKDGLTKVFKMFLDQVVYKKIKRDKQQCVHVYQIPYSINDKEYNETPLNYMGKVHHSLLIKKICEYTPRCEFIINIIKKIFNEEPRHQLMVLAHNKSLLNYLYTAITARNIQSVGYYIGGMKEKDLNETANNKKIVLATYAMAEEALDIKTLSALLMASPRSDVTQAVGRILRTHHKQQPVVYDIIDSHQVFKVQSNKRTKFYKSQGFKLMNDDTEKKSLQTKPINECFIDLTYIN